MPLSRFALAVAIIVTFAMGLTEVLPAQAEHSPERAERAEVRPEPALPRTWPADVVHLTPDASAKDADDGSGRADEPVEADEQGAVGREQPTCAGGEIEPKPTVPEQQTLRVATINTDGGVSSFSAEIAGAGKRERRRHVTAIAETFECLDADVVVLSEVHRETLHWPETDMYRAIGRRLGPDWRGVFEPQCRVPRDDGKGVGRVGVAIFSNHGRDGGEYERGFLRTASDGRSVGVPLPVELSSRSDGRQYPGGWKRRSNLCYWHPDRVQRQRGRQRVAVVAVTHDIKVVGVHLSPGSGNGDMRRRQLRELSERLPEVQGEYRGNFAGGDPPTVVAGDLNEDDCLFDNACESAWKKSFLDFFGPGWINADALVESTHTTGKKIDHVLIRRLTPVSDDATGNVADVLDPDFLRHHILYADVLAPEGEGDAREE